MVINDRIEIKKENNGWDISVYQNDRLIKKAWADTGIMAHEKGKVFFDYYGFTTILKSEYSASPGKFVDCDRILYTGNNL